MTALKIGDLQVDFTANPGSTYEGTMQLLTFAEIGGVELVRVCSTTDPNKGAALKYNVGPDLHFELTGQTRFLDGLYKFSAMFVIGRDNFYLKLPSITLVTTSVGQVKVAGGFGYQQGVYTVSLTAKFVVPFKVRGLPVKPSVAATLDTKFTVQSPIKAEQTLSVSAGVFGKKIVKLEVAHYTVPIHDIADLVEKAWNTIIAEVTSIAEDYLLRWANDVSAVVEDAADYVASIGEEIVEAGEDFWDMLWGNSSSSDPPPPALANAFADAMPLGDVTLQWGQNTTSTDDNKWFSFAGSFGAVCSALVTTVARGDYSSSLAVGGLKSGSFAVNRNNAFSGLIPFNWLALGASPGKTLPAAGSVLLGEDAAVVLHWGTGTSSADGAQSFPLQPGFGSGPVAVVVTVTAANQRYTLNVASVTGNSFTIDRDDSLDGAIPFTYIAIGPAPGKTVTTPVVAVEDFVLQWGESSSNTSAEQQFLFPRAHTTMNFVVLLSVHRAGTRSALSLSRPIHEGGFIVDRDPVFTGSYPFYWISAGR